MLSGITFVNKKDREGDRTKSKKEKKQKHKKEKKSSKKRSRSWSTASSSASDEETHSPKELKKGMWDGMESSSDEDEKNHYEDVSVPAESPVPVDNETAAARLRQMLSRKPPPSSSSSNAEKPIIEGLDVIRQRLAHARASSLVNKNPADSSLTDMVALEKFGGEDMDEIYARNVCRLGGHYRGLEGKAGAAAGDDEEQEVDVSLYQRKSVESSDKAEIARALKKSRRMDETIARCSTCRLVASPTARVVAVGRHTMLCLKPSHLSLSPYHCEIIPLQHITSILGSEEAVLDEILKYKAALARMCERLDLVPVFTEAAVGLGSLPHAVLDVVPATHAQLEEIIMSFRHEFQSCGEEWSSHKKIIEVTRKKPFHRSLPRNCSYLMVEWPESSDKGTTSNRGDSSCFGYVHPVEDESKLGSSSGGAPRDFCLDVLVGAMDEGLPFRLRRRQRVESQDELDRNGLSKFRMKWNEVDWTTNDTQN